MTVTPFFMTMKIFLILLISIFLISNTQAWTPREKIIHHCCVLAYKRNPDSGRLNNRLWLTYRNCMTDYNQKP